MDDEPLTTNTLWLLSCRNHSIESFVFVKPYITQMYDEVLERKLAAITFGDEALEPYIRSLVHISDVLGQFVLPHCLRIVVTESAIDGTTHESIILDMAAIVFQCHDTRVNGVQNCRALRNPVMLLNNGMGIAMNKGDQWMFFKGVVLLSVVMSGGV